MTIPAVVAGLLLFVAAGATAQPVAVLQIEALERSADGTVTLTLASGTTITIPETDINDQLTALVNDAPPENTPPPSASEPQLPDIDTQSSSFYPLNPRQSRQPQG